ncbi:protein GUCD1 isoform X2 [Parasteatoda tepidariorum]|uniref:protein GUCD1 isoform X2 n=1 Tax=Parasteatoda tepidariorum TaxID=114398 RepID=UPI00077F83FA|nr:protein GUCD1 isoform X2 [Parasteatoda tepidariorum]
MLEGFCLFPVRTFPSFYFKSDSKKIPEVMGGGAREVRSIEIPLVHVQQQLSWDCGVSAVMMVLSEANRSYLKENLDYISEQEGFDKSTWTIDLAYLLHKFGIRHLYSTVTIGVNPGYSEEDFYLRVLQKDAQRINDRFSSAAVNGIQVEKRSVDMEEIIDHLSSGNPAIILVNANLLFCDTCHTKKCLMQMLSCCNSSFSYQGHYIVLCGFDSKECKVLYRNPSVLNITDLYGS